MTWRQMHDDAVTILGSPREARWLVEEVAGAAWPGALDGPVTSRAAVLFDSLVARRVAGEPLQYVVGHWPFRTLDLMVDRRVLIPRPETEVVVDVALAELERLNATAAPGRSGDLVAVDLGTGSGAIALSLAAERPRLRVWGTDSSADALAVARANLAGLSGYAAPRVRLVEGHWWDALPSELAGTISLVVSNPPYISAGEMTDLDGVVVGWEPRAALEAGPRGTEHVGTIIDHARSWLAPQGTVVVEIAPHQAEAASRFARAAGFDFVDIRADLAGRDRVLVARQGERR